MNILVIGATGYIGSAVYQSLKSVYGKNVFGTTRWPVGEGSELYTLDFIDFGNTSAVIRHTDFDAVINCSGPKKYEHGPEINYILSGSDMVRKIYMNLRPAKLYVHLSSSDIYSNANAKYFGPLKEFQASEVMDKRSLESQHKFLLEREIEQVMELDRKLASESTTAVLRLSNVVGNVGDKRSSHFAEKILEKIINKEFVDIYGGDYPTADGTAVRDYINVFDVVSCIEMLVERLRTETLLFRGEKKFNVASGVPISDKQLITSFEKMLGIDALVRFKSERKFINPHLELDISQIYSATQWKPKKSQSLKCVFNV